MKKIFLATCMGAFGLYASAAHSCESKELVSEFYHSVRTNYVEPKEIRQFGPGRAMIGGNWVQVDPERGEVWGVLSRVNQLGTPWNMEFILVSPDCQLHTNPYSNYPSSYAADENG